MFEIVFSEKANNAFLSIQAQLLQRWGDDVVIEFEKRTLKVIETISYSPFIYQSTEIDMDIRKAVIHKNCSLFYRVSEQKVVLLFFWDNRQEPIL